MTISACLSGMTERRREALHLPPPDLDRERLGTDRGGGFRTGRRRGSRGQQPEEPVVERLGRRRPRAADRLLLAGRQRHGRRAELVRHLQCRLEEVFAGDLAAVPLGLIGLHVEGPEETLARLAGGGDRAGVVGAAEDQERPLRLGVHGVVDLPSGAGQGRLQAPRLPRVVLPDPRPVAGDPIRGAGAEGTRSTPLMCRPA